MIFNLQLSFLSVILTLTLVGRGPPPRVPPSVHESVCHEKGTGPGGKSPQSGPNTCFTVAKLTFLKTSMTLPDTAGPSEL